MAEPVTCPHGEVHPSACVECMETTAKPRLSWTRIGGPFAAVFSGECGGCDDPIEPGDLLQRWDYGDEQTRYAHADCGAPPR